MPSFLNITSFSLFRIIKWIKKDLTFHVILKFETPVIYISKNLNNVER